MATVKKSAVDPTGGGGHGKKGAKVPEILSSKGAVGSAVDTTDGGGVVSPPGGGGKGKKATKKKR